MTIKDELKSRSFNFSVKVIRFVSCLPNQRVFWIVSDQLLRAATSIGANVIEAQASSSKKDFIRFFEIALKSANETIYWLELLKEIINTNKQELENLLKETHELANILGSSVLTLKGKRKF